MFSNNNFFEFGNSIHKLQKHISKTFPHIVNMEEFHIKLFNQKNIIMGKYQKQFNKIFFDLI